MPSFDHHHQTHYKPAAQPTSEPKSGISLGCLLVALPFVIGFLALLANAH